jgi:hypothetical protein
MSGVRYNGKNANLLMEWRMKHTSGASEMAA